MAASVVHQLQPQSLSDRQAASVQLRAGPATDTDAEAQIGAGEERTTPLELFFDLVFVYAITQVAHLVSADPTPEGFARGAVVLATVWYAWICFAWLTP